MSTQKSILVGMDYSTPSRNALHEAARIANAKGLPLVCYHVLDEDVLADFNNHTSYNVDSILKFSDEKITTFIDDVIGTTHV